MPNAREIFWGAETAYGNGPWTLLLKELKQASLHGTVSASGVYEEGTGGVGEGSALVCLVDYGARCVSSSGTENANVSEILMVIWSVLEI